MKHMLQGEVLPASAGMIHGPTIRDGVKMVLPAFAGMILKGRNFTGQIFSAPRIRGDDPSTVRQYEAMHPCSPHPRG